MGRAGGGAGGEARFAVAEFFGEELPALLEVAEGGAREVGVP